MLEERPLVGWSTVASSDEIAGIIRRSKRSAIVWSWILTLLFPVGFLMAGLFSDEVPLNEA
ncbi:MAG: hypothetical protein GX963_15945 [Bacteroidales bacterium]|nr:hypothetical protein [Bacteroidales bacterium]